MPAPNTKPFHPRRTAFVASILIALFVWTYFFRPLPGPRDVHWQGQSMGTSWSIKVSQNPLSREETLALYQSILDSLQDVNAEMSAWDPDSQLSQFNRLAAHQSLPIAPKFADDIRFALHLAERSQGAFDPTIPPLLRIWGFGPPPHPDTPPGEEELRRARSLVNFRHIELSTENELSKDREGVELDVNATAKGQAVDRCFERLIEAGLDHVMVEIGGEVRAKGLNREGSAWRLGIQDPIYDPAADAKVFGIVELQNCAMATSGDYRNYIVREDGEIMTHILDPRVGTPVHHRLASVTILAPSCMEADGLATAAFVMGEEEGPAFIESWQGAEGLFLVREADGLIREIMTSGFQTRSGYRRVQP